MNIVFRKAKLFTISLYLLLAGTQLNGYAQSLLPETAPKYQVCRQVFDRLTYVFANSRPQPELEIFARNTNKNKIIALYKPGNRPKIQLDEEVYDLCTQLGKDSLNALAMLLSHELAHHYEKHDWHYTFGIGQANKNISKEDIRRFESEADFYGCFYGELAGFATGHVFPRILDLVYQNFNLAEQLTGYPTKEERKAVYKKKQTEVMEMVAIFKAGQFLYLMQDFESAVQCFEYLVNRFPSREILNNLAATKLQQALVLATGREQPSFVYPVELDARSRLVSLNRALSNPSDAKRLQLLLIEARKYAEKAREIDPDYIPAYINLACIVSLQGNQAAAIGVINELNPALLSGNAFTIRGIAYYKDNQLQKAQKDFETAQQKGATMASYNLALFNKLRESLTESLTVWIRSWLEREEPSSTSKKEVRSKREQIGGEETNTPLPAQTPQVKVSEKPYLVVQCVEKNDYLQLGIQVFTKKYLVRFTRENYPHPTGKKVRRGTPYTTLVNQYGQPSYTFPISSGEYLVYQNAKMAFEIDKQKRVKNWFIYARTL